MARKVDFLIVGAGIVGLAIARELKQRYPSSSVLILEKEARLGKHSSGRNSGVLHSGIYYKQGSLKARVCAEGARLMAAYCEEHGLPIQRTGKVIVPLRADDDTQLQTLYDRAAAAGAKVVFVDRQELKKIEPEAYTITGKALYSPHTAVIDSPAVLRHLAERLQSQGAEILLNHQFLSVDAVAAIAKTNQDCFSFGYLINTAGLQADLVAQAFGIGQQYTILPFKGLYYQLDPGCGLTINSNIYPVPDLRVPFLGVHFTKKVDGSVSLGPTAIPAFGRENYTALEGLDLREAPQIILRLIQQYLNNHQGFRQLVHEESIRFLKPYFAKAAQALVPNLRSEHLLKSDKIGIRAQLLNLQTQELVMDFLVDYTPNSIHILNAVSPAFTSSFSFAKFVLDQAGLN
ncbi:hypothetical protein BST81_21175 [Leptolyngbya sp. 'hensonii']|uniref:L-2-hydroxyglutarate oxidase n=1 Tax=Leptolyngbya sp. 'hensonii' TaxID=1922337 RepID=UPI0009500FCA|nr:L-2-hydroxyglutarate oxidase [Leptolyngbya sp. 'hensonii']OLP16492.1 hypothetical protein BST81_21175 [Leptolyngbya sp. 'hensonii']